LDLGLAVLSGLDMYNGPCTMRIDVRESTVSYLFM